MLHPCASILISLVVQSPAEPEPSQPAPRADRAPPWIAHGGSLDGYFLIQAPASLVLDSGAAGPIDSLPRQEFAALCEQHHVVAVTPVHRAPPRGWRDPALVAALGLDRMWIVELEAPRANPEELVEIVARFAAIRGVERAWRDGRVEGANTPDDKLWSQQWNLHQTRLDCETAWDAATNETVLVSVIDSGADLSHKDLVDNLYENPGEIAGNGKDDEGNGYVDDVYGWDFWNGDASPDDDHGHGTHVAGILGAKGNNDRDVSGVCWSANIQAVKVLDAAAGGTWTSFTQGVTYAADNGAFVTNMSISGAGGDPGLETAIAYAAGLDIVQVAAAGNSASSNLYYPAAYDGVIGVMASDYSDRLPGWSNRGDWCDLMAPGDGITSLWKKGKTSVATGTSQSTPHVAGVAALMRTLNPQLDRIDVELAIETSCDDLGAPGKDSTYQWGRLNAREAILRAASLTLEKTSIAPGESTALWIADGTPSDLYLVEPTISGREPGYTLDYFFSDDVRTVPINRDWITAMALNAPYIGIFDDFFGTLDGAGRATATLNLPVGRGMSGTTIHFCGFTVDPNDLSRARMVTNSVGLLVQ